MEQLPDKIKKDMAMDRIGRKLCKFLEEYYDKRIIEFRVAMQSPDHFIIHPMNIDGKTLDVKWDFKNATYGNEVFGYINKGDKHNESIEDSEQEFGYWQKCPICEGQGQILADGFTSNVYQQCPICSGNRIIQRPLIKR